MYSFARTKEYQKGRRCPQGMKAPVGLLSRRPVCKANAACLARQGLRYFRSAGGTNQGLLAPGNPKAVGLHTKNPSRCARGFFVFRRFEVACATATADSSKCRFSLRPSLVKMQIEKIRRFFRFAKLEFYFRYLWPEQSGGHFR